MPTPACRCYHAFGRMTPPLYQVIIGNVIGVVEEPDRFDPLRPLSEQYTIRIGAVDRRLPLDRLDVRQVISHLQNFVTKHIAGDGDSDT